VSDFIGDLMLSARHPLVYPQNLM